MKPIFSVSSRHQLSLWLFVVTILSLITSLFLAFQYGESVYSNFISYSIHSGIAFVFLFTYLLIRRSKRMKFKAFLEELDATPFKFYQQEFFRLEDSFLSPNNPLPSEYADKFSKTAKEPFLLLDDHSLWENCGTFIFGNGNLGQIIPGKIRYDRIQIVNDKGLIRLESPRYDIAEHFTHEGLLNTASKYKDSVLLSIMLDNNRLTVELTGDKYNLWQEILWDLADLISQN